MGTIICYNFSMLQTVYFLKHNKTGINKKPCFNVFTKPILKDREY